MFTHKNEDIANFFNLFNPSIVNWKMFVEYDIGWEGKDITNWDLKNKILWNVTNCIKNEHDIKKIKKKSHCKLGYNGLTLSFMVHFHSRKSHKKCPHFFDNFLQFLWPLLHGDGCWCWIARQTTFATKASFVVFQSLVIKNN
jgi:hypothetical protein